MIHRALAAVGVSLLLAAIPATGVAQHVHPGNGSIVDAIGRLKTGEYIWEPQIAPKGPMLLIVNVRSQRALLFRNGVPIAASTISSGRKGHETPTGIFTVLQKHVEHYSNKYDNAPMPYMQRLTWRGVALHGGNLPGYPASHGCIRLPKGFARLLYGTTTVGMTVVVADREALPRVAASPDIALRGESPPPAGQPGSVRWHPERSPSGPVSIVVSMADRRAVVLRNGVEIGSAPVTVDGPVSGTFAYVLDRIDASGQHWSRLQVGKGDPGTEVASGEWRRFHAPDAFRRAVARIVAPGTTVIVTTDSLEVGATGRALTVIDD
ncbi:L,D-transpeptidase family protein [Sphingomonas sp. GCM10030256]|uniref:L,D-transpeptidase family protein n=1 Tax=Sphingomonas sp. GCM10030256 TaxID=3273427 RepID=UPI0036141559